MTITRRKAKSKTMKERMQGRSKRLRLADLRRQGALLARHPENSMIDAWIERVYVWDEWR